MTDDRALVRIDEGEFAQRRERLACVARDAGYDGVHVVGRSSGTLDNIGNIFWLRTAGGWRANPLDDSRSFWGSRSLGAPSSPSPSKTEMPLRWR